MRAACRVVAWCVRGDVADEMQPAIEPRAAYTVAATAAAAEEEPHSTVIPYLPIPPSPTPTPQRPRTTSADVPLDLMFGMDGGGAGGGSKGAPPSQRPRHRRAESGGPFEVVAPVSSGQLSSRPPRHRRAESGGPFEVIAPAGSGEPSSRPPRWHRAEPGFEGPSEWPFEEMVPQMTQPPQRAARQRWPSGTCHGRSVQDVA